MTTTIRQDNALLTEENLLLPFERHRFTGDYREYLKTKRNNFIATIQAYPELWDCFQSLDEIWVRGLSMIERVTDPDQMLPGLLFMNAHSKFRVALEEGFSCCVGEAWNQLRSGIEAVAHAHKLGREPHLLEIWAKKNDGLQEKKDFEREFLANKKSTLFPAQLGLAELHEYWSNYSEWGTHVNVVSISRKIASEDKGEDIRWKFHYFERNQKDLAISLTSLLLASRQMEKAFFDACEDRLQFVVDLVDSREKFERELNRMRTTVIRSFDLKPPTIWT